METEKNEEKKTINVGTKLFLLGLGTLAVATYSIELMIARDILIAKDDVIPFGGIFAYLQK